MPYSLEISESTGLALLTVNGDLTFDELIEIIKKVWRDPHYKSKVLWDLRKGSIAKITAREFIRAAEFQNKDRPNLPLARIAFLAVSDLEFGVARIAESYSSKLESEIKVFRDYDKAHEWTAGR